jgi:hypothetical protein
MLDPAPRAFVRGVVRGQKYKLAYCRSDVRGGRGGRSVFLLPLSNIFSPESYELPLTRLTPLTTLFLQANFVRGVRGRQRPARALWWTFPQKYNSLRKKIERAMGCRTLISAVCFALSLPGCTSGTPLLRNTVGFQNEPTGFRNIEWGAQVHNIPEKLTLVEKGKSEIYTRPGDKLSFGDAKLKSIHYAFYKGRFELVYIESQPGTTTEMINTFQAQFGQGKQANQYISNYLWYGPKTRIFLNCNEINKSCQAMIGSIALLEEEEADKAASAKGAKRDF